LAYLAHEEPRALPFTEPRITAFQDICRIHGILDAPYAIVSLDLDTIRHTLQTWTAQAGEPLGVVAWNDVTALGIISAATAMGINVPNDLGVMGGDDTPVATLTRPTISSVRFDLPAEAQVIANHIAGAIGSSTDPAAGKTAAVIVVPRQSTARTRLGWDRRNGVTDLANTPS
jgi:DNA-binding LacI/PurR family transcriptional regulator